MPPFPENEAHTLISGGPKWGVLSGGQKVYAEKKLCAVLVPTKEPLPLKNHNLNLRQLSEKLVPPRVRALQTPQGTFADM